MVGGFVGDASASTRIGARRRSIAALCAGVLALVGALVASLGPAEGESAIFEWPPRTLPSEEPRDGWYAPLPLLNRVPASIDVTLPCGLATPLRNNGEATVLATARRRRSIDALWIVREATALEIGVGPSRMTRVAWPGKCPLRVQVARGELRVRQAVFPLDTGALADMPIVTGFFSRLDLRSGGRPKVVLRTHDYATSQTTRQIAGAALAVSLALSSLVLLLGGSGTRRRSIRSQFARVWRSREPIDFVILGAVLLWWILAPASFDDSWRSVVYRLFDANEHVSYFDHWGASAPQGYWLEWLRHSAMSLTGYDLVWMRLPSVAAVLASWVLCRWCIGRVVSEPLAPWAKWTLAGAFLVSTFAWSMSLRTEPFTSLLMMVGLAAMVSFVRAPRLRPIAVAAGAGALAMTMHPTGVMVLAPLLAGAPYLIRWLRSELREVVVPLVAVTLAVVALTLVVVTVDADLGRRLGDTRAFRGSEFHGGSYWNEHLRYLNFDQYGGETTLRRLSLVLVLGSIVAYLSRIMRPGTRVLTLPAGSVAVALLLLALVPSKWPWHFGALAATGAVAFAGEMTALASRPAGRPTTRLIVVLALLGAGGLWSWSATGPWAPLDLQQARWSYVFGSSLGSVIAALLGATVLVYFLVRLARGSGGQKRVSAAWLGPAALFAAVACTAAILLLDALLAPWTVARQNLDALSGGHGCGLAVELRGARNVGATLRSGQPVLVVPPVSAFVPCATPPPIERGVVAIPTLILLDMNYGLWPFDNRRAALAALRDLYRFDEIARGPGEVRVYRLDDRIPGFARADVVHRA